MNIDLSKMSVVEKKALAFDTILQIENLQQNLKIVNQEIAKDLSQPNNIQGDVNPNPNPVEEIKS